MASLPSSSMGPATAAAAGSSPSAQADEKHPSRPGSAASASARASASSPSPAAAAAASAPPPPIPVRTKESFNKLMVERYMTRDALAAAALGQQHQQARKAAQERRDEIQDYRSLRQEYRPWFPPSKLFGEGYNGFANGYTDNQSNPPASRIVYPSQKPRPGRRATPAFKYSRRDMLKQAEEHEELVPVRLEVEWDKIRLRDTLTWNLHERVLHVELFAAQLVEDMGLKPPAAQPVYEQIVQQMREQLNDFYPFAFSDDDALDPELPYSAYKNDEMRILIKLNITIGQHTLVDQFEWDLNNPANSPEDFAASMARDLSLSGEFTTAIAHCIREQSQLFTKSLYSVGHPFDGRPVEDADLVAAFLQTPLSSAFRPQQQAKDYAPYMYELNEADLERNEMVLSREQRRQKRSTNRRGGPQLPDLKDRQRTIRTLIVSSVLPGAATDMKDCRLYKKAAGTTRKRAARDGEASDSEESDDSVAESPPPSHLATGTGTARTRGMRGAASAAQQKMANLGRSETPEMSAATHHHETRTSRRFRGEDVEEAPRLLVTLRLPKDKLSRLMRGDYRDVRVVSQPQTPSQPVHARVPSASGGLRSKSAHPPPPLPPPPPSAAAAPTPQQQPSQQQQQQPPQQQQQPPSQGGSTAASSTLAPGTVPAGQIGRLPAPPPVPGQSPPPAPPPPEWLVASLKQLEAQYPNGDQFEAIMKYSYLDPVTELPVQSQPLPEGVKYSWLPRIRCLDCTTKLYTPGPDMTAQKFEAHLKFSGHRDRVRQRLAQQQQNAKASGGSSADS